MMDRRAHQKTFHPPPWKNQILICLHIHTYSYSSMS